MGELPITSSFLFSSLDLCPVGIMVVSNKSNRFEIINKACRDIFYLSDEYAHHTDVNTLLSNLNGLTENRKPVAIDEYPILKSSHEKKEVELNFSVTINESQKVISMHSSPIVIDDEFVGAIATIKDITEFLKTKNNLECATLRLENLWRLTKGNPSVKQICDVTLGGIAEITKSNFGFYGFLDDNEENMAIHSWTGETMKGCTIIDKPFIYPIKDAGLWGEAIRQRRALLVNDYSRTKLPKRGLPEGHVQLESLMVIPHFVGEKIHSVAAVANKDFGYEEEDLIRVTEYLKDVQTVIRRVEAETQLKKSEMQYRNLVETMNEGVLILDHEQVATFANSKLCELLGRDPSEIIGCKFERLIHESSMDIVLGQQDLRKKGIADPYEMALVNKAGEKKIVLSSPTTLWDDDGQYAGSYEVMTDISGIKQIEMQLLQSQKMETVGVLAAGIAHEINTPLQYIQGNVTFIKDATAKLVEFAQSVRALQDDDSLDAPLDKVQAIVTLINELNIDFAAKEVPVAIKETTDGLGRISTIVQSIKTIAHPSSSEIKPININGAISNAITVSRNEWSQYAEVETKFDENIPDLRCIPNDFDQLVLNLIVNAAQALQEKVHLTGNKGLITIATHHDDRFICMSITDNGDGIPDHVKKNIFDPFFTTKDVGKGTGMGLAIVHKIIEKQGGKIWVESEEKKGTTFHTQFPRK